MPKPVPPSPVPVEAKAPPVEDPRAGVPNPPVRLGIPNPAVAPRPVAPKVLVPRGVPNVEPDVRLVLPSSVVVPNGFPRDALCYQVGFITYKQFHKIYIVLGAISSLC